MNFLATILFCLVACFASAQSQYYVLFEYDKANVPDTAMAQLIKTVYEHKVTDIYLEGHCDSIGSKQYNYKLSKKRVKAVEQILVDNGFQKSKIHGKVGFGKDKPLVPNSTGEARQRNRRVLVKFVFGEEEKTALIPNKKEEAVKDTSITFKKIKASSKKSTYLEVSPKRKKISPVTRKIIKQQKPAAKPKKLISENFTTNSTIELPNLLFQGGRHFLMNQSVRSLDTLIKILKEKPNLIIEIQGHVCCTTVESDGYDWDTRTNNLSVTRALAIKAFLVKRGISSTRLKTKGFGGNRKLFPEELNIIQKRRNRRVEVMVISN